MSATHTLTHALRTLADHGTAVPCQGRRADRWTSDDRDERAWAASVCTGLACPLLEQCQAAAESRAQFHKGAMLNLPAWGRRLRSRHPQIDGDPPARLWGRIGR